MGTYPPIPSQRLYLYVADIFMNPAQAAIELEIRDTGSMHSSYWSLELLKGDAIAVPYHAEEFGYWVRRGIRRLRTPLPINITRINCNIGFSAERGNLAQFTQYNAKHTHAFDLPGRVVSLLHYE